MLIFFLIVGQIGGGGLVNSLIFWLIIGMIAGLIGGLTNLRQDLKVRTYPNQGIWNSLQNMIWTTAFISLPGVIFLIMAVLLPRLLIEGGAKNHDWVNLISMAFPYFLKVGLLALIFGFGWGGGAACVHHLCLRIVLWQSGTIPWDFARFLNYCVERRLLLRIGGRYRFLHRELLSSHAK